MTERDRKPLGTADVRYDHYTFSYSLDSGARWPESPKPYQPEINNRHGRRKLAAQLRRRRP